MDENQLPAESAELRAVLIVRRFMIFFKHRMARYHPYLEMPWAGPVGWLNTNLREG
jgi:hypothetical protein